MQTVTLMFLPNNLRIPPHDGVSGDVGACLKMDCVEGQSSKSMGQAGFPVTFSFLTQDSA